METGSVSEKDRVNDREEGGKNRGRGGGRCPESCICYPPDQQPLAPVYSVVAFAS